MGLVDALYKDAKLVVTDTIKGWCKDNLGPFSKFYGYMDGPLDESEIDELIYIKTPEKYIVIPRAKGDTGVDLTNANVNQIIIDNTGRFEGFGPALGGYVVPERRIYDPDFTKFGSAESFKGYHRLEDVTTARAEFGQDELRWRAKDLTPVGTDSLGRDVYVSYPKKLDIGQGLYFGVQALFFRGVASIYDKLVGKYIKKELLEAWWEELYRTTTHTLNEWIGLPKEIELVRA